MWMKVKFFLMAVAVGVTMALTPTPMHASTGGANSTDDFGNVGGRLCRIVNAITGKVGRAVATIAVIFLGLGAFFGKVTWGLAVAVSIGIFAIFGASTIVNQFGGTQDGGRCLASAT